MPKFRFVAVDSDGMFRDGTIDAADGASARDKLAANGLMVRELHEIDTPAEPRPGSSPPLFSGGKPYAEDSDPAPAQPQRGGFREDQYDAPRRPPPVPGTATRGKGTKVLAILAVLLTIFSVVYICFTNPPWGRLSKYDFSTPEAALRSEMQMTLRADVRATAEYEVRVHQKEADELMNSLKVEKTAEYDGKKAVFFQVTHTDRDAGKQETDRIVQWFEKHESGYWVPTRIEPDELREKDPKLAKEIEEWRKRN